MAGVQVQINDGAWVTTDAQGQAAFDPVAPPFVLRTHQVVPVPTPNGSYRYDFVSAVLPQLTGLTIDPGATCVWMVAWCPLGRHLVATRADAEAPVRRVSVSETRTATFQ